MTLTDNHITYKSVDFNPFDNHQVIEKIIPTNEPQKEIWLSCMLGGDDANRAYNESVSLDFKGKLHAQFFASALRMVIERHEAMRATISPNGEMLVIQQAYPFELEVTDWSEDPENQDRLKDAFISEEMDFVFPIVDGPLYRFHLHKLADEHYLFTVLLHHIIADGWSTGVILDDLSKFYNQLLKNGSAALPAPPQISTYADDIAAFQQTKAAEETNTYWLNQYQGDVPVLDLPTDFPRPAKRTYNARRFDFELKPELITQIKKTGAKNGCSMVSTLLHAFELFLYQKTHQTDVIIGLPAAGQAATENPGLVGHCVNLLPLRASVDTELSFNAYLKRRKPQLFDAYDHQLFTYGQLIKKLNIKRDHSRIPMVPVIFNIDLGMDQGVSFDQLKFKLISNPRTNETFEIFLNISGAGGIYTLEWSYNTQLFKPETISQMALDFQTLLQNLTANPDVPIRNLGPQQEEKWKEAAQFWSGEEVIYPKTKSLTALIDDIALNYPNNNAISFAGNSMTYFELKLQSDQLANELIIQGLKKGHIVGLAAERSMEMLIAMLAIMKCGAAYLPLDPDYPTERIEYMLDSSQAQFLLVSDQAQGKFISIAQELSISQLIQSAESVELEPEFPKVTGDDLAYILYTSGSTGKPKGVQIKHYNLNNFLWSMQKNPGLNVRDKVLAITTISFDIATLELFLPLITGAEIILCDRDTSRDGRRLLEVLNERQITFMQATPATWRMLIDAGWDSSPELKVLCGGEAFPPVLAETLLQKTAAVYNVYGPTETTVWSSIKQLSAEEKLITIGRPIQNTNFYILNPELQPLTAGQTGEIYIGGDGVGPGYLNQPGLTAERFIPDPFIKLDGAQMYQSGDLGKYTAEGEIVYMGRADQQIKIRGYRIEPGEIESVLHQIDEIKTALIIAREDTPGDQRMVAYVILQPGSLLPEHYAADWKAELRTQLPEYMIPQDYVVLDQFPLTPNHKVDRKALPKPASQSRLSVTVPEDRQMSKQEILIADIWSNVLGLTNPSPEDDFFEVGGHSLLAVKVMTEIEKVTGKRLPLATLFDYSTIAGLARKIADDHIDDNWDVLVPIKRSGTKDPLYLIHGGGLNILLFGSMSKFLDDDQPVYGLQALGMKKEMDLLYTNEEIAAKYLSEILESNPDGPYCLAGYSMGGKIAFEIANQLQAMGKTVKFLGIIDTYATNEDDNLSDKWKKKIIRQFKKIPFFISSFISNPKEAWTYQAYMIKTRLNNLFTNGVDQEDKHFSKQELEIAYTYYEAYQKYKLVPSDFKIHLFRVDKRLYFLDDLKYLGWSVYAKQGVVIHPIPGDHRTFLYPPYDKGVARAIQDALNEL